MTYVIREQDLRKLKTVFNIEHLYRDVVKIETDQEPPKSMLLQPITYNINIQGEAITHFGNILVFYLNKYYNMMDKKIWIHYDDLEHQYHIQYQYNPLYDNKNILLELDLEQYAGWSVVGDSVANIIAMQQLPRLISIDDRFKVHRGVILMRLDNGVMTEDAYHYRNSIISYSKRLNADYYFYPKTIGKVDDLAEETQRMSRLAEDFGLAFETYPEFSAIKIRGQYNHVWIEESLSLMKRGETPKWYLVGWWTDSLDLDYVVDRARECYRENISKDETLLAKIKITNGVLQFPVNKQDDISIFTKRFNLYFISKDRETPYYAKTKTNYVA